VYVKVRNFFKQFVDGLVHKEDVEIAELRHDIEALDQYLRIQNLRRAEEARFVRMQRMLSMLALLPLSFAAAALLSPSVAHAASFEGSLQSLVGAVVGRIMPILSLGFVGKNIFSHIQNDPEAGRESVRVAVGVVMLLGVNGVWAWLQAHVR
jgi:hypothetical protein